MAFIVFEGGEGAGKTTQLQLLYKIMQEKGKTCTLTREPGGTPLAEQIRTLFKQVDSQIEIPTPLTELLLVSAARAQHIETVIQSKLQENHIVICDRFLDSTYVYQSILGNLPKQTIDSISQHVLGTLIPDLTFIFITSPAIALERLALETNRPRDRMDSQQEQVHHKIRDGYAKIFNEQYAYPNGKIPQRVLINGDQKKEDIHLQIKTAIAQYLGIFL